MSFTCAAIAVALLCHCPWLWIPCCVLRLLSFQLLVAATEERLLKTKLEVGNALEIPYLGALRSSHVSQNHGVPRDLTAGTCCKPYTDYTLPYFHLSV